MRPDPRPTSLLAVLAAAAGVALGGCGSGDGPAGAGTDRARLTASDGSGLFAQADCGSCHRLAAAKAGGTFGPDLDDVRPSAEDVEDQVRSGGDGMPSFERRMSDRQITAVARYVAELAGRGR